MGKLGNKQRKKRYARTPAEASALAKEMAGMSQEDLEFSYPSAEEMKKEAELKKKEVDNGVKHPVVILEDNSLEYPELWLSVYIEGSEYEKRMFGEFFSRAKCWRAECLDKADFAVFTGGPDVDPALYGERRHPKTSIDTHRDNTDLTTYLYCADNGIPMLGICRGAQFLHVCNGGKLYQDVDNHYGDHPMWDRIDGQMVDKVSSNHHQMVMENPANQMVVIATAATSRIRYTGPTKAEEGRSVDIEAFFYRDTVCLGIQGHPEYRGYKYFSQWAMKKIENYFVLNPDLGYGEGKHLRLKSDLLGMRKQGLADQPSVGEIVALPAKQK